MPIRVMIVEDSRVVREFLELLIGRDPRLQVAASVASAEEALARLDEVAPDVISLDIRLPGMNGLEATTRIMSQRPTPIVICSASVEAEELKISMNALRAGALAVVEKPVGTTHRDYELLAERLCTLERRAAGQDAGDAVSHAGDRHIDRRAERAEPDPGLAR
jgi:two-component system chemotaxis response regulator CheB